MNVIKRNGEKEIYSAEKVKNALNKAFLACEYEDAPINEILQDISIWDDISVEEIQDQLEELTMSYGYTDVARAFIIYRYQHNVLREGKNSLVESISAKLSATNIENQNANIDEASFGGRLGEATRIITKEYALNNCMSEMARNNHLNNEIYIHDLDSYAVGMHNCLSIPFDDLLAKGFKTRQVDIRPANSINTAFQLVAVIFQIQSLQQFGGCSATHLDWTMVPYVRKSFFKHFNEGLRYTENYQLIYPFDEHTSIECDTCKNEHPKAYQYAIDMTKKELNQAVEGMYHNLNSLQSRSGKI